MIAARRLVVLLGLWAPFAGCGTRKPATLRQLEHRATFDLACPAGQLRLHHVDERTKAVTGCGRALVYVEQCDATGEETRCSWLANTPPLPAPSPPPSAVTLAPRPAAPPAGSNDLLNDRF